MNINKNYKKGNRIEILKALYSGGALPYRALRLLNGTERLNQRLIRVMEKEGYVEICKDNRSGKKIFLPSAWREHYSNEYGDYMSEHYELNYMELEVEMGKAKSEKEETRAERYIRCGEICLLMHMAGIGSYPDEKKVLGISTCVLEIGDAMYFSGLEVKRAASYVSDVFYVDGIKQVINTRLHGLVISPGGDYAIYNIGRRLLEWEQYGETKMSKAITDVLYRETDGKRKRQGPIRETECILFGEDDLIFSKVVTSDISRNKSLTLMNIEYAYNEIYGLPTNKNGIKMMRIMKEEKWKQKMKHYLLEGIDTREESRYGIVCDGVKDENTYILLFCIPNLQKLKMFLKRAYRENNKTKFEIYCFSYQIPLLVMLAVNVATIRSVELDDYIKQYIDPREEEVERYE